MKKLFALVFLVSLAGSAKPPSPTLVVNCTPTLSGACDAGSGISFSGTNYNTRRSYVLFGQSTSGNDATFTVTLDTAGSFTTLEGILPAGTWTFSVLINNNIHRDAATVDVVLE